MRGHPLLCVFLSLWTLQGGLFGQANDNFADRLALSGPNPIAVTNLSTANAGTAEPNHAWTAVGKSL